MKKLSFVREVLKGKKAPIWLIYIGMIFLDCFGISDLTIGKICVRPRKAVTEFRKTEKKNSSM